MFEKREASRRDTSGPFGIDKVSEKPLQNALEEGTNTGYKAGRLGVKGKGKLDLIHLPGPDDMTSSVENAMTVHLEGPSHGSLWTCPN